VSVDPILTPYILKMVIMYTLCWHITSETIVLLDYIERTLYGSGSQVLPNKKHESEIITQQIITFFNFKWDMYGSVFSLNSLKLFLSEE
jgi:hypothetical protein